MYCFAFHVFIHFVYISTGFRYNSSSQELPLLIFAYWSLKQCLLLHFEFVKTVDLAGNTQILFLPHHATCISPKVLTQKHNNGHALMQRTSNSTCRYIYSHRQMHKCRCFCMCLTVCTCVTDPSSNLYWRIHSFWLRVFKDHHDALSQNDFLKYGAGYKSTQGRRKAHRFIIHFPSGPLPPPDLCNDPWCHNGCLMSH